MQYDLAVRDDQCRALVDRVGRGALWLLDGVMPVSCAEPAAGLLLASVPLPAQWARVEDGTIFGTVPWMGTGVGNGWARYWRLVDAQGVARVQDYAGPRGARGLVLSRLDIQNGAPVRVVEFTIERGNR